MMIGMLALMLVSMLASCQPVSTPDVDRPSASWQVLERIGDVRMTAKSEPVDLPLLPGQKVADGRQVTAGRGALLILGRNGVQLTAGENTSLRLSDPAAASGIQLDSGWLRVRLASAVNRGARIKTPHFDISASSGILTLRANDVETGLSIETGRAVLATPDGRYRATLAAGAAARIDRATGSDVFIRSASGQPFKRIAPLPTESLPHDRPENSVGSIGERDARVDATFPLPSTAVSSHDVNVLRASNDKKEQGLDESSATGRIRQAGLLKDVSNSEANIAKTKAAETDPFFKDHMIPSSMPPDKINGDPIDLIDRPAPKAVLPESRFDLLTEGLLDGL